MRLSVLPLVVLFIILASFVFVSPVSAQDEVPPEPEVSPTETEPVEESPVEALEEIGVVIVDEQGESLPLASELAGELLTGGDPYFKVGTVTHRFMEDCSAYPGDLNCHVSATPIQAAVDFIAGGKIPSDGKIYFDSGTDFTEDVLIDGVAGLKGMIGAVNPMDNLPNVTINGHLWVRNTSSGFTLNGFNIQGDEAAPDEDLDLLPDYPLGVLDFTETAGTLILSNLDVTNSNVAGEGIVIIEHNGAVTLTNVDSSDNAGGGMVISIPYNKSVTIKNSSFDHNSGNTFVNGIYIETKGPVLIIGVTARWNNGTAPALWLSSNNTLNIKNSIVNQNVNSTGINNFQLSTTVTLDNITASDNGWDGISLMSKGNITANHIQANGNGNAGAYFDTCLFGGDICANPGVGNVIITNSEFNNNKTNNSWGGLTCMG